MHGHLAIVGATGAVGRELCKLLAERPSPPQRVTLLASSRSVGETLRIGEMDLVVQELTNASFAGVNYAIFSAGGDISRRFGPLAVKAGAVVIDNSSAFRMDEHVPLVVPEINPQDALTHQGIIANPNCSTIIMNLAVWPLHRLNPVTRIVVSTYQAASGAGAAAMDELRQQSEAVLAGRESQPRVFPFPIAFNLFSHDTPIGPDGYNTEERKMIDETRKIFHEPSMAITATCVRVPVFRAHSESINLSFRDPISPDQVREILKRSPGLTLVDGDGADASGADNGRFPMPIDAAEKNDCLVGRIRQDASRDDGRGIDLFVCGDQLRKGAALNALQILDLLTS